MGFKFNALLRAILAGSASVPPAPAVSYGATADAGEVNTSDSITGTRYWFDSNTGSDANPGTSAGSPAQSLAKLYDYTIAGGSLTAPRDSGFMLSRGDTWNGFIQANNNDGTAYGNYLFGAAGTGARPKIYLTHSAALNNTNLAMGFFNRAGTLVKNMSFDLQNCISVNATPGAGTFVVDEVVTGGTSGATGVFQHKVGADNYVMRLTSHPTTFIAGETITGGTSGATATSVNLTYTVYIGGIVNRGINQVIESVDINDALGNGVAIAAAGSPATGLTINNVTVSSCCTGQSKGAGIDGGGFGTTDVTVTNNTVYDCGPVGGGLAHNIYLADMNNVVVSGNHSYMTTNNGNHALVIHGVCTNWLIEDNLFEKCNNGIGINDGYTSAEYFDQFTIRRNINRLHGTLSGQAQGQAMDVGCLTNSAIYNNLHYTTNLPYSFYAKRASGGADSPSSNNTISHETIYNVAGGLVIAGTMGTTTNVFQNMILMSTAASGNILSVDAAAYPKTTLRNCLIWMPNNSGNAILWNGTSYTLAAWMTAVGNALGCINADPLFVNAATGDFRLQAGSPCKLAGYNSGIATDFADNARHATTPSMGAYE